MPLGEKLTVPVVPAFCTDPLHLMMYVIGLYMTLFTVEKLFRMEHSTKI